MIEAQECAGRINHSMARLSVKQVSFRTRSLVLRRLKLTQELEQRQALNSDAASSHFSHALIPLARTPSGVHVKYA